MAAAIASAASTTSPGMPAGERRRRPRYGELRGQSIRRWWAGGIGGDFFDRFAGEWRGEQQRSQRVIHRQETAEQSYRERGVHIRELATSRQPVGNSLALTVTARENGTPSCAYTSSGIRMESVVGSKRRFRAGSVHFRVFAYLDRSERVRVPLRGGRSRGTAKPVTFTVEDRVPAGQLALELAHNEMRDLSKNQISMAADALE